MYAVHDTLLGNTQAPTTPSLFDSFLNLANSGVQAGFDIYNRVQNIKQTQQTAAQAQEQARILMQMNSGGVPMAYTQPMTGVRPGMISSTGLPGWIWPIAIGVGAVTLFVVLRRK